jgi:hypothetical protein
MWAALAPRNLPLKRDGKINPKLRCTFESRSFESHRHCEGHNGREDDKMTIRRVLLPIRSWCHAWKLGRAAAAFLGGSFAGSVAGGDRAADRVFFRGAG